MGQYMGDKFDNVWAVFYHSSVDELRFASTESLARNPSRVAVQINQLAAHFQFDLKPAFALCNPASRCDRICTATYFKLSNGWLILSILPAVQNAPRLRQTSWTKALLVSGPTPQFQITSSGKGNHALSFHRVPALLPTTMHAAGTMQTGTAEPTSGCRVPAGPSIQCFISKMPQGNLSNPSRRQDSSYAPT